MGGFGARTRAAILKRPFENCHQMSFTEPSRQAEYDRLTASLVWARTLGMSGEITLLLLRALTTKLAC
jgi:hypothetical protein